MTDEKNNVEEKEVTSQDIKDLTEAIKELDKTLKIGLSRIVEELRYIR